MTSLNAVGPKRLCGKRSAILARINRVTTIGELAASLAHELGQPITGAITNASTCLRKLDSTNIVPDELRTVVSRFAKMRNVLLTLSAGSAL